MSKESKSCYNKNSIWPKEKENQKKMNFLVLTWLMKKRLTQGKEELVYVGWSCGKREEKHGLEKRQEEQY